jgi:hypothetical protein
VGARPPSPSAACRSSPPPARPSHGPPTRHKWQLSSLPRSTRASEASSTPPASCAARASAPAAQRACRGRVSFSRARARLARSSLQSPPLRCSFARGTEPEHETPAAPGPRCNPTDRARRPGDVDGHFPGVREDHIHVAGVVVPRPRGHRPGKRHMRGGQHLPPASISLMNARAGAGATRLSREGLAHAVRSGDCESRVRHGSGAGVPRRSPRLACVRYRRG